MAVRIESKTKSDTSNSLTVGFTATEANDLILIFATVRSTGATLAVSGYTGIGTQTTNDACRSRPFIKIASAGETSATVTTGTTAAGMWVTAHIIRGGYTAGTAADAVDDSDIVSGATGYTMASGSVTTNYNNGLIFDCASWDNTAIICDPSDCNLVASAGGLQVSGTRYKATAGAVSTFTWTGSNNSNAGMAWTVAIRDSGSGEVPVVLNDGRDYLHLLGGYSALTALAPDSVTGLTAINGVNMNTAANTTLGTLTLGAGILSTAPWLVSVSSWACTQNLTATAWVGNFFDLPAAADVSGKPIFIPYALGPSSLDSGRVGPNGNIVVLVDSADKWIAYQILPQASWTVSGYGTVVIKPGTTTYLDASLTTGSPDIDLTDIVTMGYFHQRAAGTSTSVTMYFAPPVIENAISSVIGGGSVYPVNAKRIAQLLLGGNVYPDHCSFQGNGQLVLKSKLQIGNGSSATYSKLTAQSIETPSSEDTKYRAGNSAAGVYIKGSASDTVDLRSAIFSTEYAQPFEFDAAHSTSAAVLTTGLSVVGPWDVVWIDGETASSISFTGCDTVATKGADFSACTVTSTVSANASMTVDTTGSTLDGCTIDGTGAAYALELGTSVTAITLTDCTLTAGSTDKVSVLKTTGTVTITISGTTSLVAGDVTSAGATVVIAAPLLYQTVTVSGATAGSRIQIYDTTSSTELYNGTPTFPYTWTDSVAAAADRAIRLRVSYVSGVTAKDFIEANIGTCGQTSGTAAVSYLVNQVADATYNSNAIDGPAIYATSGITFTDAATDRVNCNIGGGAVTYKTIYACFVYWNFTSTGIANDFTYISAPDTANYLLSGMKIRNTSATDLSVTGGYGRDATSGASVDIIDTAGSTGNIFLAPDHVVAYATGSGVTAQDITDIAAATAAAVPSASTIATTTVGTAIDGTTTLAESIRLHNSVLAGKVSGAGTGTETFRDLADIKDRIVATVDSSGNRTAITRDAT